MTDDSPRELHPTDPPVLLAMMIAARKTGDRLLEQIARRELEALGIRVSIARDAFRPRLMRPPAVEASP